MAAQPPPDPIEAIVDGMTDDQVIASLKTTRIQFDETWPAQALSTLLKSELSKSHGGSGVSAAVLQSVIQLSNQENAAYRLAKTHLTAKVIKALQTAYNKTKSDPGHRPQLQKAAEEFFSRPAAWMG